MRIALVPLDSRPPNWQFPQRLAEIAGVELLLPPRELLGSLRHGADGLALARWLCDTVSSADGGAGCDAAIFSWDALVYGGLVQSRDPDRRPVALSELAEMLEPVDWQRVAGYAYLTVPRLGITVESVLSLAEHQLVREYFILAGAAEPDAGQRARLEQIEISLGERAIAKLWRWRERNHALALEALAVSARLGLRCLHAAVEDNAPSGPHLAEAASLHSEAGRLTTARGSALRFTAFDGADECACLLVARAVGDARALPPLPVQLTVHPAVPGPDRYTGLYESHSLGDGLTFLAGFLGLDYRYDEQPAQWLVVHGVQPQPDVFESDAAKAFTNPYLLPKRIDGAGRLWLADLCACNGANPHLVEHIAGLAPGRLSGLVGFNTNFNTLGVCAAWLRLGAGAPELPLQRRFLLERLADDVVYQSIARPQLARFLRGQQLDAMDFGAVNSYQLTQALEIVASAWQQWCASDGEIVLQSAGISATQAEAVSFSFPWSRAFECEAEAPL